MKTLLIKEIGLARGYGVSEYHNITSEEQWRAFVSERIGGWCFEQHQDLRENYQTKHEWDTDEQMIEHIGNLWGYYVSQGIDFAKELWYSFDHSLDHCLSYVFPDGLLEVSEDTYDLHINAFDDDDDVQVFSHQVSGSALVSAIDNFGANNIGWGNEIELENTDQTARVLMDLGIAIPTADNYSVVARPQ